MCSAVGLHGEGRLTQLSATVNCAWPLQSVVPAATCWAQWEVEMGMSSGAIVVDGSAGFAARATALFCTASPAVSSSCTVTVADGNPLPGTLLDWLGVTDDLVGSTPRKSTVATSEGSLAGLVGHGGITGPKTLNTTSSAFVSATANEAMPEGSV